MDSNLELQILYQEMYELTEPECAHVCRVPRSCCSPEYCQIAEETAIEEWGVDVEPFKTQHPTLPFMSESGCRLPPHLRPMCTLHTCQVNGLGCKVGDMAWTEKYFTLREKIEQLEFERHEQKD